MSTTLWIIIGVLLLLIALGVVFAYILLIRPWQRAERLVQANSAHQIVATAVPVFQPHGIVPTTTPEVFHALDEHITQSRAEETARLNDVTYSGQAESAPAAISDRVVALLERIGAPMLGAAEQGVIATADIVGDQYTPVIEHSVAAFSDALIHNQQEFTAMVLETAKFAQTITHINVLDPIGWQNHVHNELMRWGETLDLPPEDVVTLMHNPLFDTADAVDAANSGTIPFVALTLSVVRQRKLLQAGQTDMPTALVHGAIDTVSPAAGAKLAALGVAGTVKAAAAVGVAFAPPVWLFIPIVIAGGYVGSRVGKFLKEGSYRQKAEEYRTLSVEFVQAWNNEYQQVDNTLTAEASRMRTTLQERIAQLPLAFNDPRMHGIISTLRRAYETDLEAARRTVQVASAQAVDTLRGSNKMGVFGTADKQHQQILLETDVATALADLHRRLQLLPDERTIAHNPTESLRQLIVLEEWQGGNYTVALLAANNALQAYHALREQEIAAWQDAMRAARVRADFDLTTMVGTHQNNLANLEATWGRRLEQKQAEMNLERGRLGMPPIAQMFA